MTHSIIIESAFEWARTANFESIRAIIEGSAEGKITNPTDPTNFGY